MAPAISAERVLSHTTTNKNNQNEPHGNLLSFRLRTRRETESSSSSTTTNSHTFAVPSFSYRMTIVDHDVPLQEFESHLVTITVAHLETALAHSLASSSKYDDWRVDYVQVTSQLHQAFLGLDESTGEPQALVHCDFEGTVVLSHHGFSDTATTTTTAVTAKTAHEEETQTTSTAAVPWLDASRLQQDVNNVIQTALMKTDLLYQRFAADSILDIVKDLTVHVKQQQPSHQQEQKQEKQEQKVRAPGYHPAISLTGIAVFSAILLCCCTYIGPKVYQDKGCKSRARISPAKGLGCGGDISRQQEEVLETTAIMDDDDDEEEEDNKLSLSCLSSPVFS